MYGTYTNYFGMQNANTKNIKTEFTSRNADVIKALGGTKLAIIGYNAANSVVFTEQVKSAANKTKGLKTVYINHDIPVGTTEFGSVADQIKQSGADSAVHRARQRREHRAHASALKQAGREAQAGRLPRWLQPAGARPPGVRRRVLRHRVQAVRGHATKSWKGSTTSRSGWAPRPRAQPLSQITGVGWISANTMIEGIKAAGVSCPTRKAFINNLRLEKGYTGDGFFDDPETTIDFAEVYGKPFHACTTCTSRTSSSCRSSTASRSAPSS